MSVVTGKELKEWLENDRITLKRKGWKGLPEGVSSKTPEKREGFIRVNIMPDYCPKCDEAVWASRQICVNGHRIEPIQGNLDMYNPQTKLSDFTEVAE